MQEVTGPQFGVLELVLISMFSEKSNRSTEQLSLLLILSVISRDLGHGHC